MRQPSMMGNVSMTITPYYMAVTILATLTSFFFITSNSNPFMRHLGPMLWTPNLRLSHCLWSAGDDGGRDDGENDRETHLYGLGSVIGGGCECLISQELKISLLIYESGAKLIQGVIIPPHCSA